MFQSIGSGQEPLQLLLFGIILSGMYDGKTESGDHRKHQESKALDFNILLINDIMLLLHPLPLIILHFVGFTPVVYRQSRKRS